MPDSGGNTCSVNSNLFKEQVWREIAQILTLTPRELQIVQGVFDDEKNAGIAMKLGVSRHTVNTYLVRLFHKLKVSSRVQLVLCVVCAGLGIISRLRSWTPPRRTN